VKVAMICQPWDPMRPPVTSGSVAIWVYEICRRLAKHCEMTIFAQQAPGDLEREMHQGVEYRRIPLGRTGRVAKLKHRLFGRPSPHRPFFASHFFCSRWIESIARELRDRQFDVAHIQNYSQFVPVIRRFNPDINIILHMRCEWLLQLDRRMLINRVGEANLVLSVGGYLNEATRRRFPENVAQFMTLANGINLTYFDSLFEGIDIEQYQPKLSVQQAASRSRHRRAAATATGQAVQSAQTTHHADELTVHATGPDEHDPEQEATATTAVAHEESIDASRSRVRLAREQAFHLDDPAHDEEQLILFVSRISPEKGVHDLIRAFAIVHRTFPRCRLRLIGPPGGLAPDLMLDMSDDPLIRACEPFFRGDYMAMLKELITALERETANDNIHSNDAPSFSSMIEFIGHVPHDELPHHYRQASMLAAPSLSEAFGRTPIEAMACGVPVVGTAIGGIAETVVPLQTGLLVPAGDPEALGRAMVQLLASPELRVVMGVKGWLRVAERYTWESIAARTRAYYEQLLATRSM